MGSRLHFLSVSLYLSSGLPALSISSAADVLFRSHNDSFYAVRLRSRRRKADIYPTELTRLCSSLYLGTFLMKCLSLLVCPAVPVHLFLLPLLRTTLLSPRLASLHTGALPSNCVHLQAAWSTFKLFLLSKATHPYRKCKFAYFS